MGGWRVQTLTWWWRHWNDTLFDGVLEEPILRVEYRNRRRAGAYIYGDTRPCKPVLYVSRDSFDDDEAEFHDTIIHEMVHQYQDQVLGVDTIHDAQFWKELEERKKKGGL